MLSKNIGKQRTINIKILVEIDIVKKLKITIEIAQMQILKIAQDQSIYPNSLLLKL